MRFTRLLVLSACASILACVRVGYTPPDAGPDAQTVRCDWTVGLNVHGPSNTRVNSSANESHPFLAADRQSLYFISTRDGNEDVYLSSRPAEPAQFGSVTPVAELNTASAEGRFEMSNNGLEAFVASNRDGGLGGYDIWHATRDAAADPWGMFQPLPFVNSSIDDIDPHLTSDSLTLWLASKGDGGSQDLRYYTRPDAASAFDTMAVSPNINSSVSDSSPSLSADQRVIVFASDRPGGAGGLDLWYAVRPDTTMPFGEPQPVPVVNTASDERDPFLRPDGCELFFVSNRSGGSGETDVYNADVSQ